MLLPPSHRVGWPECIYGNRFYRNCRRVDDRLQEKTTFRAPIELRWPAFRTKGMRIAFDLDDTIIRGRIPFPEEPLPKNPIKRFFCRERIRLGTVKLMNDLRNTGNSVWIYTTSFRPSFQTKLMFRAYGAKVERVINQHHHQQAIQRLHPQYQHCSKYPPAFDIDVLIDECDGVLDESKRFNFSLIQVFLQTTTGMNTLEVRCLWRDSNRPFTSRN